MILTLDELVMEFKFLKKNTVYKLTSKREIPYKKLHRRCLLFDKEEIIQWMYSKGIRTNDEVTTQRLRKKKP